jgi:type II secretory pathway component GspD/PulD (secretin)
VENRLQSFKTLKAQQDFDTQRNGDAKTFNELRQRQAKAEDHKQKLVQEQMKLFDTAYKEGRYKEAEMYAQRAHELDLENAPASAAVYQASIMRNQNDFDNIKDRKERMFNSGLDDAEDPGPAVNTHDPLRFEPERWQTAKQRKVPAAIDFNKKNEREREIEHKLTLPITPLNFKNIPMSQAIDDLRASSGINIVIDKPALDEEQRSLDQPVTMHLDNPISTKAALSLLLHLGHLTYVIEDEVLKITTDAHSKGRMELKTYQVADLVIPIMNSAGTAAGMVAGVPQPGQENRTLQATGVTPFTGPHSLPGGSQVGTLQNNQSPGSTSSQNQGTTIAKSASPTSGMEDTLIKLITTMIKPESWDSMGGPGSIDYFPLVMALTINQTPDIQEQVQELLQALRRLQDIEVSVEIKFITIAESYFERIGMDFNINIETNNTKFEPQVVSNQFQPFGFVNEPDPKGVVVGLQPTGTFTNSLDIPITSSSFNLAAPPFGGYPNIPGADGGLSLGLAFLSDIQVFLFMEAAQGDRRTNVMQAPKLTMFNGQTATITILDTQFFVTDVNFFLVNGQVVFFPINTPFSSGVTLTMSSVVTADRRFVRMNLAPTITNLSTPVTALFPVTAFITPFFEGGGQGQPVPFTMFLQQPAFTTISVTTTVMVPDGGTVLMGGLKTLSEGRNEFGPPILSKLPYINRLFKNVGYGRDAQSLLIMVTPRVIINEEEEYRQTGVGRAPEAGEAQSAR